MSLFPKKVECSFKAGTRQADFKELAATNADCVVSLRRQRLDLLEHTAQTATDYKSTRVFCTSVRGISSLYQQLTIVYICHSKGETETRI